VIVFEKPGEVNTVKTVELAIEAARAKNIKILL